MIAKQCDGSCRYAIRCTRRVRVPINYTKRVLCHLHEYQRVRTPKPIGGE